ncbi:MAG: hypothetical protein Q8K26_04345 [Candidatus Gracilibacteria bacterium]|nr:hypothetical protein [Candidatus Gracilibacteria bacterium]
MRLGITGRIGSKETDKVLSIFNSYWRGINALLEGPLNNVILLQDPRGKIIISKTGRDALLVFGTSDDCDLPLSTLQMSDTVEVIISALHDRIHELTATARAIIHGGFDPVGACKILDSVDRHIEAICILSSR